MRRTFVMLSVSAVLSVLLAGCGNGGQQPAPIIVTPTTPNGDPTVTATAAPTPTATVAPTPAEPTATTPPAGSCAETQDWGTGAKEAEPFSTAPIYQVRIGRHQCYDRVVFDLDGPDLVGYGISYRPVVIADGSGEEIPVEGGAALQVILRASPRGVWDDHSDQGDVFASLGEYLHGPRGLENWRALRAVRSAGWFEGYTTFAIGVREQLPYRVTTWVDEDEIMHVIVDIAHNS